MMAMYAAIVMGWKITAREANWRCCAMESATSLRAATLSASEVRVVVVRGGTSARGLEAREVSSSAWEVMVASEEGCNGGSVPEDDGSRRGVDVVEFSVEGARTRFARRKEKKAGRMVSWGSVGWLRAQGCNSNVVVFSSSSSSSFLLFSSFEKMCR